MYGLEVDQLTNVRLIYNSFLCPLGLRALLGPSSTHGGYLTIVILPKVTKPVSLAPTIKLCRSHFFFFWLEWYLENIGMIEKRSVFHHVYLVEGIEKWESITLIIIHFLCLIENKSEIIQNVMCTYLSISISIISIILYI